MRSEVLLLGTPRKVLGALLIVEGLLICTLLAITAAAVMDAHAFIEDLADALGSRVETEWGHLLSEAGMSLAAAAVSMTCGIALLRADRGGSVALYGRTTGWLAFGFHVVLLVVFGLGAFFPTEPGYDIRAILGVAILFFIVLWLYATLRADRWPRDEAPNEAAH